MAAASVCTAMPFGSGIWGRGQDGAFHTSTAGETAIQLMGSLGHGLLSRASFVCNV